MHAIDDQPAPGRGILERRARDPGLAVMQRRHGVEQVRDSRNARPERGPRFRIAQIGMPGADPDPGGDQRRDRAGIRVFGCERHHDDAAMRPGQQRHHFRIEPAEMRGIMDALARGGKARSLDMDADDARHARGDRRIARRKGLGDAIGAVADERGKEGRGSEGGMGGTDPGDALHAGIVVEQGSAAAIDLGVDKAGHQPPAVQVDRVAGHCPLPRERRDAALRDLDFRAFPGPSVDDDLAVAEAIGAHWVRVTLAR